MHDSQFRQLLDRFNYSWTGFRRVRKGVKKRLARHMHAVNCHAIETYIAAIENYEDVRQGFERCMTVSISRFYRDRNLWDTLQNRILPLLSQKSSQAIQIWFAGCAGGEEVYSFKIIWDQYRNRHVQAPDLRILATDLNPDNLDRAQSAIYPKSSLREVAENIRTEYFTKVSRGRYQLGSNLKEGIKWRVHDLRSEPPGFRFNLIFLRNNLLTYYADNLKTPAFKKIIRGLFPTGFLVIGRHEKIPIEAVNLMQYKDSPFIYQTLESDSSISAALC